MWWLNLDDRLLAEWQAFVARCAQVLDDDDVLVESPVPVAE